MDGGNVHDFVLPGRAISFGDVNVAGGDFCLHESGESRDDFCTERIGSNCSTGE